LTLCVGSSGCAQFSQALTKANFSHALTAKVKKILPVLPLVQLARRRGERFFRVASSEAKKILRIFCGCAKSRGLSL
jgi:hypothetical protein